MTERVGSCHMYREMPEKYFGKKIYWGNGHNFEDMKVFLKKTSRLLVKTQCFFGYNLSMYQLFLKKLLFL